MTYIYVKLSIIHNNWVTITSNVMAMKVVMQQCNYDKTEYPG